MLNPIHAIKQLYQIQDSGNNGIARSTVEQAEAELGVQFPPMLYHYLLELGNVANLNSLHNQVMLLPLERISDYIIIAQENQGVCVWGLAQDELTDSDPMVFMSQNYDAIESSEIHWHADRPLSAFLVAQAVFNGTMGGLTYNANVIDFTAGIGGDLDMSLAFESEFVARHDPADSPIIPADLLTTLAQHYTQIAGLATAHEQYFTDDFTTVIMVTLGDSIPNAVFLGSENEATFIAAIDKINVAWDYRSDSE